jgi:serine/threonine protein kinase
MILQNILVESTSGDWLVKIADFGCSKRSQTGGTELRTVGIGTLAYMAPEVYGGFRRSGQAASYSETVDMWPIGVITYELLCHEHPFSDLASVSSYAADTNLFPTNRLVRQGVEDTCVNFIRGLMTPNPDERPTSSAARQHVWLVAAASEPTAEIPDSDNESE